MDFKKFGFIKLTCYTWVLFFYIRKKERLNPNFYYKFFGSGEYKKKPQEAFYRNKKFYLRVLTLFIFKKLIFFYFFRIDFYIVLLDVIDANNLKSEKRPPTKNRAVCKFQSLFLTFVGLHARYS